MGLFSFGGSAEKSKSTSTSTSQTDTNGTFSTKTTPIVPDWASSLTQGVAGRVGSLMNLDPYGLVPSSHPLQDRAAAQAGGLTGLPWNFDAAADLTRGATNTSWLDPYMNSEAPSVSGGQTSDYVDRYMNPYLHDVVDSTAADFDAHAGQVRAQQALDLAGAGAFGGSGAALTQSMTEGELARGRASTLAGLRSHAYDAALGAAAGDADRATQARIANAQTALQDRAQKVGFGFQGQQQQLAAANQLAGLSSQFDGNMRANIATQAGLGDTFRGIQRDQLQAPITNTQQLVALLGGLPMNLFVGQDQEGVKSDTETSASTSTSKTKGIKVNASASLGLP